MTWQVIKDDPVPTVAVRDAWARRHDGGDDMSIYYSNRQQPHPHRHQMPHRHRQQFQPPPQRQPYAMPQQMGHQMGQQMGQHHYMGQRGGGHDSYGGQQAR